MNKLVDGYESFKREVAIVRDEVVKNLKPGTKEEILYKGWHILFSGIIERPKFMFIGINPGAGRYKDTGGQKAFDNDLEPSKAFEYIDAVESEKPYDYRLARETRKVFMEAGLMVDLRRSVKSNFFYVTTTNKYELDTFLTIMKKNYNIDLLEYARKWTAELIEMINPHVIICEGKAVGNYFSQFYGIGIKWKEDFGVGVFMGRKIIVYKRKWGSLIVNKSTLVNILKEL